MANGAPRIAVDAAFDLEAGIAGIGMSLNGQSQGAELALADDVNAAEVMAILRGMQLASELPPHRETVIFSDSTTAVRLVREKHRVKVKCRPRRNHNIRMAHGIARVALKGWRAGSAGEATWSGSLEP